MAIPNTTYATAITIPSLPFSVTTTANDAGVTYDLWYQYVGTTREVISIFGYATGVGYSPLTIISQLVGGFPDSAPGDKYFPSGRNIPLTFPIEPGETYFIQFDHVGAAATTATVTLDIIRFTPQSYPDESLLIPDDTWTFPGAILSPTTGVVLKFYLDFYAGELGDALESGPILLDDYNTNSLKLLDAHLNLVTSIPHTPNLGPGTDSTFGAIFALQTGTPKFYVGRTGYGATPATIRTVSTTGVVGGTVWTLPVAGLTDLAVNSTETIAYVTGQASSTGFVKKWDLVNSVMLADHPAPSGQNGVWVMKNDHVIVVTFDYAAHTTVLREYDSADTLLHTYTFTNNSGVRVKPAADNPVSIWLWFEDYSPSGISRFIKFRLSDGVHLQEVTRAQFEMGASQIDPTATPSDRFGHSFSCPMVVLYEGGTGGYGGIPPEELPPYVAPAATSTIRPIRRLRRAPHVAQENMRVFYRRFELDLERGVGLATGQGENPLVMLRLSRDGGHTWGEELTMSAGRIGAYTQRVIARRLGSARDTVFEITVSDPVAWSIVGAWLDLEAGTN